MFRLKQHLGTLLIILGIIAIAFPLVGKYQAYQRQQEMMAYLEETEAEIEEANYDELSDALEWGALEDNQGELELGIDANTTIDELDVGDVEGDSSNLSNAENIKEKPDAIGLIQIDKIDVKLPVAEGADLATLKFALGHMPETADLGSIGNSVIAGHRSHSFGTFFNRLDEVEVGDEIKVKANGKEYVYEVYETLIVEPDDLSVLRGSSSHRVLTLITCTPMYTSTHRLIVHAVVREE